MYIRGSRVRGGRVIMWHNCKNDAKQRLPPKRPGKVPCRRSLRYSDLTEKNDIWCHGPARLVGMLN